MTTPAEPRTDTAPKILVVDDEPTFAATLADVLETRGYSITPTTDGKQAIAALGRESFDLALVDLRLPDMSGIELLSRIRESSPPPEVIILTGYATVDTAVRAMDRGAFGYLEKPYNIERLFLLIERALAKRHSSARAGTGPGQLGNLLLKSDIPAFAFTLESGHLLAATPALKRLLKDHDSGSMTLNQVFADPNTLADHLTALKEHGHAQTDIHSPGRTTRWYRAHSSVSQENKNTVFSILFDITPSRQREASSARIGQYFEAIFNNLAAGVVIVDSSYVIQQVNPAFARLFGTTPSALVSRKCHDVIHRRPTPCHLHGEVCPIKNCLATGATFRVQHRHLDAQDRVHFVESTMAPLHDETGTIVSFVAIFADFTEIKTAQQESEKKTRQLERLNRELTVQQEQIAAQAAELKKTNLELIHLSNTKNDFVSMVSHELRTPLTAISEGVSLVADGTLGPVGPRQSTFLDLALNNTHRLADLINDLLDLSKIEAGRVDIRPAPLDLSKLLSDTGAAFAAAARKRNLQLLVSPSAAPLRVYADQRMVRRILNNLLSNALKFTDKGEITLSAGVENSHALVTVVDTGIGIPASEQSRVFEKFHQAQHRDGQRPVGTGLGLALTQEMVRMSGGEIRLESEENKGTSFFFTLPRDTATARIWGLLKRHPPSEDKSQHRELLLVRIENGNRACRDDADGIRTVLETVEQRVAEAQVPFPECQILPDEPEVLLLLTGDASKITAQHKRIRDILAGATFIVRNQVTDIRLSLGHCTLEDSNDPAELLKKLGRNLAHIN